VKKPKPLIVSNNGENKIMIVVNWHPDPDGGPAIHDYTASLLPGQKIDLSMFGIVLEEDSEVL
jgi:hypothetical protein